MKTYLFRAYTRKNGAIGDFWPEWVTVEAATEEEARSRLVDKVNVNGCEMRGADLLETK